MRSPLEEKAGSSSRRLAADLFHALSQPLTGLNCALEMASHSGRTLEECRQDLAGALGQAEQIALLANALRQLFDAQDPGEAREAISLGTCAREIVGDLAPMAEAANIKLLFSGAASCLIWFDRQVLRQTLYSLLEMVVDALPAEATLEISVNEHACDAVLDLASSRLDVALPVLSRSDRRHVSTAELLRQCRLEVSRRVFEVNGGNFELQHSEGTHSIRVRLPLAASNG